jgi:hypothetical protein
VTPLLRFGETNVSAKPKTLGHGHRPAGGPATETATTGPRPAYRVLTRRVAS